MSSAQSSSSAARCESRLVHNRHAHSRPALRARLYGRRGYTYSDHFQEGAMHNTQTHADAARMGMHAQSNGEEDGLCAHSAAQPQSQCNHAHATPAAGGAGGGQPRHRRATAGAASATTQLPSAGEAGRTWVLRSAQAAGTKSSCGAVQPLYCWLAAIVRSHFAAVRPRRCQKARRGQVGMGRRNSARASVGRHPIGLPPAGRSEALFRAGRVRLGGMQGGNIHRCGGAEPCKRM